ncbi:hypothetical protein ACFX1Z_024791 [Malus domestica]
MQFMWRVDLFTGFSSPSSLFLGVVPVGILFAFIYLFCHEFPTMTAIKQILNELFEITTTSCEVTTCFVIATILFRVRVRIQHRVRSFKEKLVSDLVQDVVDRGIKLGVGRRWGWSPPRPLLGFKLKLRLIRPSGAPMFSPNALLLGSLALLSIAYGFVADSIRSVFPFFMYSSYHVTISSALSKHSAIVMYSYLSLWSFLLSSNLMGSLFLNVVAAIRSSVLSTCTNSMQNHLM